MPLPSGAADTTVVRESIPFDRLPWIRPLVAAQAHDYASVAPLFAGNPADPAAWRDIAARLRQTPRDRAQVARVLDDQLAARQAPDAARRAAARLADPDAVAVVTGQQAGLFGGPLYTLLKAVTAIQLARRLEQTHGVPAIPVFWVDAEDHDFAEIRTATLLDRDFNVTDVTLADVPGAGRLPVAALRLDAGIEDVLAAAERTLAPTEFTPGVLESLRRRYAPGTPIVRAFAGWLDDLLGGEGLVVFESADPGAKPLAAPVFARELASPCLTADLARAAGAAMAKLGHAPQIDPGADVVCLFYVDEGGRQPIRWRDGQFVVGDRPWAAADLAKEAAAYPERFSPNVLLRPLVQDTLFPTACYVGGPSELAYQAQLGDAYRAFGTVQPLLASRVSVTVLDSAAAKFFDRYHVPLESLHTQDESALNRLLSDQLPPELDRLFADLDRRVSDDTDRLKPIAAAVDPTLAGAVDTTLDRIRDAVKTLQGKILQASKKKDETLRRQFVRTRTLTFPSGHAQERVLNVAFFVNRYGPALPARLIDTLPPLPGAHLVITP